MKKKRYLAMIAGVLVFCVIAGGCSLSEKKEEISPETGKAQEITYCTWEDEKGYTEKIVSAFEAEHTNIHVNVSYIDGNLKEEEISELLDQRKTDVIGIKNINDVLALEKEGKVIDLTKQIADSEMDVSYYGNMYNDISDNGKYYCLPTRKTSWVLVYNPDIFEKEGFEEPKQMTWDEYAELSDKMTSEDGNDKVCGTYLVDWVYNFMGIQEKEYLYDDDQSYLKKSLELMHRVYYEDQSSVTPKEMEKMDWITSYEQGKVAMMPMGEWFVGQILEDEKNGKTNVSWDLAPMPTPERQADGTTWGTYQLAAITKSCDDAGKTEAAFAFLKYLCGEDGAKIYAANGMIPAYIDDDIENTYKEAVGDHNAEVFFDAWQIQEEPVYEGYTELEKILENEAVKYLNQEQDIDRTMDQFEKNRLKYFQSKK